MSLSQSEIERIADAVFLRLSGVIPVGEPGLRGHVHDWPRFPAGPGIEGCRCGMTRETTVSGCRQRVTYHGTGTFRCSCGAVLTAEQVADHKERHGLVVQVEQPEPDVGGNVWPWRELDELSDRLYEFMRGAVLQVMLAAGEDTSNKALVALRCAQVAYGLDSKAKREQGR